MTPARSSLPSAWPLPILGLILLAGCGGGTKLSNVTGKVTYDGQPLTTGTVTFHPKSGEGSVGVGDIDSNGQYTLQTGTDPGVPPGEYIVTVVAATIPEVAFGEPEAPPQSLIPTKYAATETSPLTRTVSEGNNTIDLVLEK